METKFFFSFKFLRFFLLAGFFLVGNLIYPQEGGYSDKMSVVQGDTLTLFISTSSPQFTLSVYRVEVSEILVATYPGIIGSFQAVPDSSFIYGCRWDETYKLIIPDDWKPGAYRARFPIKGGAIRDILFFVKAKSPGSFSHILMVMNQNTWQAYNNFGGKSLYGYNSTDGQRTYKVSFLRPSENPNGHPDFHWKEQKFINWAYGNNFTLEYAVNHDIHADPDLLSKYDVVVTTGHSEYWSRNERLGFEKYVHSGGRVIILSGNSFWWQIRYEDEGNTLVCYKEYEIDPLFGVVDSLVTNNWIVRPLWYPENILTGVSFENGGYVNSHGYLWVEDGYGDFAAYNTHHWVYEGTGVQEGDEFGYEQTIAGYEVDGALFTWQNGIPVVTGEDQTPQNFRILGITPAMRKGLAHGTIGIYHTSAGGALFNAPTVDWVEGLNASPVVDRVTLNVLNKFLQNRFPPEILSWTPFTLNPAVINNEQVFLNERDIFLKQGEIILFSLDVNDPYNEQVNYFWEINGVYAGSEASINFINSSVDIDYFITANVYNSKDTSSISWRVLNTIPPLINPPDSPKLLYPNDGTKNLPLQYTLKWEKPERASTYAIEVSKDPGFKEISFSFLYLTDTLYNLNNLEGNTKYFWRVKSRNKIGESTWSEVRSFSTVVKYALSVCAEEGSLKNGASLKLQDGSLGNQVAYCTNTNSTISFLIDLPVPGNWYLWGRLYYSSISTQNSFFAKIDAGENFILGNDDLNFNDWHWDGYRGRPISLGNLKAGIHTLIISGREPRETVMLDKIILTNDVSFQPNNVPNTPSISIVPEQITLYQNYPNPFNPETTIKFSLPENSQVTLKVYDILGNEIVTLADEVYPAGFHYIKFNGTNLTSGVYICRIKANEFVRILKMQFIK